MVVILVPPVCARDPCDRCLGHNGVLHTLAAGCPVRCSRAHARHCLVYPSQCLSSIRLVSYDTHGMWAVESKSGTSRVKTLRSSAMAATLRDARQHHDVAPRRHARGPQGADGAAGPSTLRPWQSHASDDVSATRSTRSHTCDQPLLARAKRSNIARGGARAMVA